MSNIGTRFGKKLLRISAAGLTSDRPNGKFVVVIMKESQQRASSGGPKMANDGHDEQNQDGHDNHDHDDDDSNGCLPGVFQLPQFSLLQEPNPLQIPTRPLCR